MVTSLCPLVSHRARQFKAESFRPAGRDAGSEHLQPAGTDDSLGSFDLEIRSGRGIEQE